MAISLFSNPLKPTKDYSIPGFTIPGGKYPTGPTGGFLPPQGFYDPSKEGQGPNVGFILDFLNNGGLSGRQPMPGTQMGEPIVDIYNEPGRSPSPTSPMAAGTSGSGWPDPPNFRPGYQQNSGDTFSAGDAINNIAGLAEWLSSGLGITPQSMDILSGILSGNFPASLEQFPTGLSDQLLGAIDSTSSNWMERGRQLSKDMTKDIWGMMKSEVVDPLSDSVRDRIQTQVQAQVPHAMRRIEDTTSGGARAQGMIDVQDEAIKSIGQGLQEALPQIGASAAGAVLPGLSQQLAQLVELSPQLNLMQMYPNVLSNYMNSVRPNMLGAALTQGSNFPLQLASLLQMALAGRTQLKAIKKSGGGGGGLFGGLF